MIFPHWEPIPVLFLLSGQAKTRILPHVRTRPAPRAVIIAQQDGKRLGKGLDKNEWNSEPNDMIRQRVRLTNVGGKRTKVSVLCYGHLNIYNAIHKIFNKIISYES
jgi:hypothetical protein